MPLIKLQFKPSINKIIKDIKWINVLYHPRIKGLMDWKKR
jgi:hypothetical protein